MADTDNFTRRDFLRFLGMGAGAAMIITAKTGIDRVHASQNSLADNNEGSNGSSKNALLSVRRAMCSCYGPGLYGRRTACGKILQRDTVGVAHKSMTCGKLLKSHGPNGWIRARVIDRGPYTAGREFDLTEGLVKRMGYANCADFGVRSVRWDYA